MDYAAFFLGAGRPNTLPRRRWRMALTIIYTCRALAKKHLYSIVDAAGRYVAIDIRDADDGAPLLALAAGNRAIRGLVKEKRLDDLRRLGGAAALATALSSDPKSGIPGDDDDIRRRQEAFGRNATARPKPKSFLVHVVDALRDVFLLVLSGCAVVSLGFGIKEHGLRRGWYEGVSIFVAVFLVAVVSAVSNHGQAKRFAKLASECDNIRVAVLRDGRRQEVSTFAVVVGDIVLLNTGDQVPADGVFLDGYSLQVDESSMTGEPHPVAINADDAPFLSSGTKVVDGNGTMLVTAVGGDTAFGEMMSTVTRENADPTPLQERLESLTANIGKAGITVAVLVFTVLVVRYFTGSTADELGRPLFDRKHLTANGVITALFSMLEQAVTIIVVAIPEGLPLAVTLSLAFSMKRMMKDHALVRRLSACETMGAATVICTDKTGTLTMNEMAVTDFWVGREFVVTGSAVTTVAGEVLELLRQGVGMNTTGSVYRREISGSPTEKALLSWAVDELQMDVQRLKEEFAVVDVETFNSEKKRSGVVVKENGRGGGAVTTHWKGAAEIVVSRCVSFLDRDGISRPLDSGDRAAVAEIISGMAGGALRCIAFAYKTGAAAGGIDDTELTLLGIVGLKDPCRREVRAAIAECRRAGVAVKMITGDNLFTARAIAKECGIIDGDDDDDNAVFEGHEFRCLSDEERLAMADKILVMARSSPMDKLLMVQSLKKKGHVVAVTGDGTNDAPALKAADIGLSMGIQGTAVAKESSDVVILDDNFRTAVAVMHWGRCVYANIQKFIQFQLTVNIAALVVNFVAAVSLGRMPLTTVQMLWVNLIMDTMGALALATDRPTPELLQRPPVGRGEPLISAVMWRNLLVQAAFQLAAMLVLVFRGQRLLGINDATNNTVIFNTFVLCQLFNEFNSRKLERINVFGDILANKLFLAIVAVTIAMQVLMVEVLQSFAGTVRLNGGQWAVCILISSLSVPIAAIAKTVLVGCRPARQLLRQQP